MPDLMLKDETYAIVGAAMEVHREKGFGFAEPVCQECMEIELADFKIPTEPQKELPISYKGRRLKKSHLADFVVFGKIIVELKALEKLTSREESQAINYLRASNFELGLLINSGAPSLEWKRIVLTDRRSAGAKLHGNLKSNS
ncbi:MAG TPA: GxxExxY protein [Verrucomicrobiae bacterium]|nr:GxxExxY protein [Verrucomicrobiae bacterium]